MSVIQNHLLHDEQNHPRRKEAWDDSCKLNYVDYTTSDLRMCAPSALVAAGRCTCVEYNLVDLLIRPRNTKNGVKHGCNYKGGDRLWTLKDCWRGRSAVWKERGWHSHVRVCNEQRRGMVAQGVVEEVQG